VIVNDSLFIRTFVAGIPENHDVGGYPEKLNPHMITELLSIESDDFRLAISYSIQKISNVNAMALFDSADYYNRLDIESYESKDGKQTRHPPYVKKLQSRAYERNIESLFDNEENLFRTSLIIIAKSETEKGLRAAESRIKSVLKGSRVYYDVPDTRHLKTFASSSFSPDVWKNTTCECFSYHAALLLPIRSPGSRLQAQGSLFGETALEENPRHVLIDLEKLIAQHLIVCGSSGSGKTYFLLQYIMRSLVIEKKRVVYITPKTDEGTNHLNVVRYFHGCLIELGRGKSKNINPLEILHSGATKDNAETIFYDHVDILKNFVCSLILSETASRDNMIPYLEKTIYEVYEAKGIYKEDPKTWKNWPYLSDLYRIWETQKDDNVSAEALYNKGGSILTSWNYLNQPSNIASDLTNDLMVFDTSGMRSAIDKLQDSFNIIITGILGLRFKGEKKKTTIVIDEARVFLQTPQLSSFLMRILMEGRSARLELVLAVQQPSDLIKANSDAEIKTNCPVAIILGGMSSINVNIAASFFSLSESNKTNLLKLGKGHGLVLVGNQAIPTKFKSTELEHSIIKGTVFDENTTTVLLSKTAFLNEQLEHFIREQKVIFEDWVSKESDCELLRNEGYISKKGLDAITGRNTTIWIQEASMPTNQTIDHVVCVTRIAGHIICRNKNHIVKVNPFDDVDIVINDEIAIEYERAGSHSFEDLVKKRDDALQKYKTIIFVCQIQNYDAVSKAVGKDRTIKRGKELAEWIEMNL
jgi:hypothetical protein